MEKFLKGVLRLIALMGLMLLLTVQVSAQELTAEDISGRGLLEKYHAFQPVGYLFDGSTYYSTEARQNGWVTLRAEQGMGSLYFVFGEDCPSLILHNEDTGETREIQDNSFLHLFVDLEELFGGTVQRLTITFPEKQTLISELSVYTAGQVPDSVQRWQEPKEHETDLVLFSAHGDDEQLFFAGLLPYYGAERGYQVQVVYLTDHRNQGTRRRHEMLNGLWAVGIKTYPVFGTYGDYQTRSLADAYSSYESKGITREELLGFVVEQLRRFRPKVAVGHDLNGEYGHGMHRLYADLLCQAVQVSQDREAYPELAERYGVWDVPKTYLLLYGGNVIWMDWDQPLEAFDGMTAYQVTKQLGFASHPSQHGYYSWFFEDRDKAVDIPEYSPCWYGLYRSTVGEDVQKQDLFENLTSYEEDAKMEQALKEAEEARCRAEQEQAAAETEPEQNPVPTLPAPTQPSQPEQPDEVQKAQMPDWQALLLAVSSCGAFLLLAAGLVRRKGK